MTPGREEHVYLISWVFSQRMNSRRLVCEMHHLPKLYLSLLTSYTRLPSPSYQEPLHAHPEPHLLLVNIDKHFILQVGPVLARLGTAIRRRDASDVLAVHGRVVHLGLETHGDTTALLALVGKEEDDDERHGGSDEHGLGDHEGADTGQVARGVFAFEEEGSCELASSGGACISASCNSVIGRKKVDIQFIKESMVDFLVVPPTLAMAHE